MKSQKADPKMKTLTKANVSKTMSSHKLFGTEDFLPLYIKLLDGKIMKARLKAAVIRLYSSRKKEGHGRAYGELVLFYPWQNED